VSSTGARVSGLWRELERERRKSMVLGFPMRREASYRLQGRRRLSWASRSGGGSSDPLVAMQLLEEDDEHLPHFVKTKRYLVSGRLSGLEAGLDAAR
jgi:hypothetical protein